MFLMSLYMSKEYTWNFKFIKIVGVRGDVRLIVEGDHILIFDEDLSNTYRKEVVYQFSLRLDNF